jgi:hypothetical protein
MFRKGESIITNELFFKKWFTLGSLCASDDIAGVQTEVNMTSYTVVYSCDDERAFPDGNISRSFSCEMDAAPLYSELNETCSGKAAELYYAGVIV